MIYVTPEDIEKYNVDTDLDFNDNVNKWCVYVYTKIS